MVKSGSDRKRLNRDHKGTRSGPCSGSAAAGDRVLILDTSTPKLGQISKTIGRLFNRRNRRMHSRAIWGLKLPGRYWFITFTSSPESPPLEKSWDALRKWLKRYRPGITWLYCFTIEGQARYRGTGIESTVIHMVVRLGMKQKRIDAAELREAWTRIHNARQVKIKYVPPSRMDDLAAYLANQKMKRGLAKEMGYQSAVTRWRWSKGWLPKGFTKAFGRAWVRLRDVPYGLRLKVITDWLLRYNEHDGDTWAPGKMFRDPEVGWVFE